MLSAIRDFFERNLASEEEGGQDPDHRIRLATTALLYEMVRMDEVVTDEELRLLNGVVRERFAISAEEADELMALAEAEAAEAVGYHQFTSLINDSFSPGQKVTMVEYLWQLAYADKHLDKHEEYMVRKLAELLYVPHRDFIAAKHRAREAMEC